MRRCSEFLTPLRLGYGWRMVWGNGADRGGAFVVGFSSMRSTEVPLGRCVRALPRGCILSCRRRGPFGSHGGW
jgi:hypothetical protein